jgi:uncharacterized peroxidase-related enzyme
MSRIEIPAIETATGATAEIYGQIKTSIGGVPNTLAALGHLTPAGLKAFLNADGVLGAGSLGKKDLETIRLVVSENAGCDYCVAAHTAIGKLAGLSSETMKQVRAGQATGEPKRDALVRFVRYLVTTSGTIDREVFDAIKAAGYTDQQLAEISLAIGLMTVTNTFNRINDTVESTSRRPGDGRQPQPKPHTHCPGRRASGGPDRMNSAPTPTTTP